MLSVPSLHREYELHRGLYAWQTQTLHRQVYNVWTCVTIGQDTEWMWKVAEFFFLRFHQSLLSVPCCSSNKRHYLFFSLYDQANNFKNVSHSQWWIVRETPLDRFLKATEMNCSWSCAQCDRLLLKMADWTDHSQSNYDVFTNHSMCGSVVIVTLSVLCQETSKTVLDLQNLFSMWSKNVYVYRL